MNLRNLWIPILLTAAVSSCADSDSAPFNQSNEASAPKYLYVASGACYAGGAAVSAGSSNTIARFDLRSGELERVVIDYNQLAPGDQPVALADFDADSLLVLVQNTAGRRLHLVRKDGSGFTTYLSNATALTGTMRDIELLPDLSVLVSKSIAVEKFNAGKSRMTIGASPFINAPGGTCATATTMVTSIAAAENGMIVYTHATA